MSITRHHAEWLSLIEVSGPFLSLPVLAKSFPQGLHAHDSETAKSLRLAFDEWEANEESTRPDPAIHREWVKHVLNAALEYGDALVEGQSIPPGLRAEIAEHGETLRPDWVLLDPGSKKARLLVKAYPRQQALSKPVDGSRWKASPDTRMTELLHATGVRLGLVTNGDQWMLVNAVAGETSGYASWYANLWFEEPLTLRAFRSLLAVERFFGVADDEAIETLLTKSAENQQEVTDQLGYQVRRAVEVLIQSLDKADRDYNGDLLKDIDEAKLYESALTVMMRLVFLFCAEERGLLLLGDDLYDRNYAVSTLRQQLQEAADQHGEEILGLRYDAWARLLTTFRAVYSGVQHHDLKLPPYGGHLFNPDRFPFLEGRPSGTNWRDTPAQPLPVTNQTVLHLLKSLQLLEVRMPGRSGGIETQRISFRSLDIEQIGHVYEGLLDHTAKRATEPVLGLAGTRDKEPEIALAQLEKLASKGEKELLKLLKEETGRSESALKKGLDAKLDDQIAARLRTACRDPELWNRVKPFAGLVRNDSVDYPVVINNGSVFVTSGTDRRSSGTHYTPKSLTEPIVQYTLEPLVYVGPAEGKPKGEWQLKSPKELLSLKICDMACGSGAFLVQVCRYLAERLLEAWDALQRANPTVRITPEGEPSTGQPGEMLIPDDPDERQTFALRIVAQRCVYGVDKNPLAVEMAKLSLWLLTLAKDKPFEFLDHAIRSGDSLVGIHDLEQLRHYSLKPDAADAVLFSGPLDREVDEAINLRLQLVELQATTIEDVKKQVRLHREASDKMARLRCAADLLVAAEFWGENAKDKLERVRHAAVKSGHYVERGPTDEFEQVATKESRGQSMFHWPLEFPEVMVQRGGFDAFVGNPPFLGGTRISTLQSEPYIAFLIGLHTPATGNSDLCAHFFRRAFSLLHVCGFQGLLATNTIAQGDTRDAALSYIVEKGGSIYAAQPSMHWPGTAAVEVSVVHISKGAFNGPALLGGVRTASISPLLDSGHFIGEPKELARTEKLCFRGSDVNGAGFFLTQDEATSLRLDGESKQILRQFINAEEINSSPIQEPSRWVINFGERSEEEARHFSTLFAIVEERVQPERAKNKNKKRREVWWLFDRPKTELYEAIQGMQETLLSASHTKYVSFVLGRTDLVYSHGVNVVASNDYSLFAVLQSTLHEVWARRYGSSLKDWLRYTPSDCFRTFPFPADDPRDSSRINGLYRIGEAYHSLRRRVMNAFQEGITCIYNRFHNSDESSTDIQQLRELQVELDQAVTAAYGWNDLELGHGFHETKQGIRFTINEPARREVLQRLLKLNHERYAAEVVQGMHGKKKGKGRRASGEGRGRRAASKPAKEESTLFDKENDE